MKLYEPCPKVSYILFSKIRNKLIVEQAAGDIDAIVQYCIKNKMQFQHLTPSHFDYLHFLEYDYPGRTYKFRRSK